MRKSNKQTEHTHLRQICLSCEQLATCFVAEICFTETSLPQLRQLYLNNNKGGDTRTDATEHLNIQIILTFSQPRCYEFFTN